MNAYVTKPQEARSASPSVLHCQGALDCSNYETLVSAARDEMAHGATRVIPGSDLGTNAQFHQTGQHTKGGTPDSQGRSKFFHQHISLLGTILYLTDLTVTLLSNSTASARFSSVMIGKTTNSTALTGAPTRAWFSPIRLTASPMVTNFSTATEASR